MDTDHKHRDVISVKSLKWNSLDTNDDSVLPVNKEASKTAHPCNKACAIMDKAGIPHDISWRGIVNAIRIIESDPRFTVGQKNRLQAELLSVIKSKDFSQVSYRNFLDTIDTITHSECLQTRQELSGKFEKAEMVTKALKEQLSREKDLFNDLLRHFSAFIEQVEHKTERRKDDVEEMKDTTVTAIQTMDDKIELIDRVNKIAATVVGNIQSELESLREKALDVDIWKQKAHKLAEIASIDKLTGLYNRRAFDDYLSLIQSAETDPSTPISVLLIDIDNFKKINDLYGHDIGDQALKLVASIMRQHAVREDDFVVRYGGDEMGIVCFKQNAKETGKLAEKIRGDICAYNFLVPRQDNTFKEHTDTQRVAVPITVSIGVAGGTMGAITGASLKQPSQSQASVLLKAADNQLYVAKKNGRNQVCSFQIEQLKSNLER